MASKALAEQLKARWREFTREPSAFFFVIFMPILWMAILGFAFSGDSYESYGVGWVGSEAPVGELYPDAKRLLEGSEQVRLVEGDEATLKQALRKGEVLVLVEVGDQSARFLYDSANKESKRVRDLANDLVQQAAGRTDPVLATDEPAAIAGTRYIDFLVPGLLALSIMTTSLFGTGMTIVVNRRENLLKRYLATPMRPMTFIVSHIVGRGYILVIELVTILLTAWLMFRFWPDGSLIGAVLFAVLGAAAFTSLALLCGSRTSNASTMNGMTNLLTLPMMIVSGVWFSRSNFPDWIAEPARYLPLTPLVDGLRHLTIEGGSLWGLQFELIVLSFYLVASALAAKLLFKWY